MGHIVGKSRGQIEMLCLDEMVDKGSPARQIDKFIDNANTSFFEKTRTKSTGRSPFNPKDLLKLFVYGMDNGVTSSRKLERECKCNIEVMWLLNGLAPDDRTICNFRRENAENMVRFFNEFAVTLAKEGYIDGKILAVDGTKIRANNSRRKNYSAKKLDRHIEYINERIAKYLSDVDKNDKIEELEARKARYELYKERIRSGEASEVSTTDPDSRLMKVANNGMEICYNIQTAVDGKNKLIAGALVTNEANDQCQLYKVIGSVKKNLMLDSATVLADKGYYNIEDFKNCNGDNILTIVAPQSERKIEGIEFKKDDFTYDQEKDCYYCPVGKSLNFFREEDNGHRRYGGSKLICRDCEHKKVCTKAVCKVVTRHKYASHAEQNDKLFKENYKWYKLRQQLSEHPFGTIKRTMGIQQFLTRGLRAVTAEVALIFTVYNLKRLRTIGRS